MTNTALVGAAGKMGLRLTTNPRVRPDLHIACVEHTRKGRRYLRSQHLNVQGLNRPFSTTNVLILAVPGSQLAAVTAAAARHMRPRTMFFLLDAAALFAEVLALQPDVDFFGDVCQPEHIVCAMSHGQEATCARGEALAGVIFARVLNRRRITVHDFALLEPVLSEDVAAMCLASIPTALDAVIARGVPAEAARDFLLGHLSIELAIVSRQMSGGRFSDGAISAIRAAEKKLLRPDWLNVLMRMFGQM